MLLRPLVAALLLTTVLPAPLLAAGGNGLPALSSPGTLHWRQLTPAQREVLAPLESEWPDIDPFRREKWLELAGRFPGMPPEERERVQARMRSWAQLSPQARSAARLHFQEFRQMSPDERRTRWEQYRELPEDQRRSLAERAVLPAAKASAPVRTPSAQPVAKSNTVPVAPVGTQLRPLSSPAVLLQAKPGATTTLVNRTPTPPQHLSPGQPKIAATRDDVDPRTLLPRAAKPAAAKPAPASAPAATVVTPPAAPVPAPALPDGESASAVPAAQ
jgi:hypothetical protein